VDRHSVDSELVARLLPVARAVLRGYRLAADDQRDVMQEGWLLLLANLHTVRDPMRLAGWLRTTVHRQALRQLRRRHREISFDPSAVERSLPAPPSAEQRWLRTDRDRVLWTVVAWLPAEERRIVQLMAHDPPLTARALAARLGVSPSTAARMRARTLRRLRRLLIAEGVTGP
jgi:RNA polymerase sigma factor (sigma-70 family)